MDIEDADSRRKKIQSAKFMLIIASSSFTGFLLKTGFYYFSTVYWYIIDK